jgi:hypothetical protein
MLAIDAESVRKCDDGEIFDRDVNFLRDIWRETCSANDPSHSQGPATPLCQLQELAIKKEWTTI